MAGLSTLIAALLVAPACAGLRRQAPLSPSLKPEDHNKFFDHDYPDDKRPAATKAFDFQHPFPVVQDSEDYDKDYVKDENTDGGEWRAQEQYDNLRSKLQGANAAMNQAKAAEEASAARLAMLRDAEKAEESMGDAEKEVNLKAQNLEDCQKKLEAARAELRNEMAARDAAIKNLPTSDKSIDEINADVKHLEHEVAMAASKLRSYRHSSVDSDGGVYYMTPAPPKYSPAPLPPAPAPTVAPTMPPPKSGTRSSYSLCGAVLALAAVAMFRVPA